MFATARLPQCSEGDSVSLTSHRGQGLSYGALDRPESPQLHEREKWVQALTWPSYGRSAKYFWDEANVEWALPEARYLFVELASISPDLIILAHSMGNRAALDMVSHWQTRHPGRAIPLKRLIMASPDVDRGMLIQRLSEEFPVDVTLYGSRRDQPLSASWRSHGYPRAGDLSTWVTGKRNAFPYDSLSRVEVVDTSEVAVGTFKHSDYIESPEAAADLCRVVAATWMDGGRRKIAGHPNASILVRQPKVTDQCTLPGREAARLARR